MKSVFGKETRSNAFRLRIFSFLKKGADRQREFLKKMPRLRKLYTPVYEVVRNPLYRTFRPKGRILLQVMDFQMYVNSQDIVVASELMTYGLWERNETELFKRVVKPSMVIADIGANVGYYSLMAAKLVGQSGKVYAFEPEPNNFNLLRTNIAVNHVNTILPVQRAVSNESTRSRLFLDKVNHGAHSLSESNIPMEKGGAIDVDTITLDDFFKALDSKRLYFI